MRGLSPNETHTLGMIKRAPETLLVDLAERLVCQRCGENGPLPTQDAIAC
jgi:hypothetical protein